MEQIISGALPSLAPPQLAFDRQGINAVVDDYSSVRTVQAIRDIYPTARPRIMELVNSHLEGIKSLFDQVLVGVVNLPFNFNQEE